MRSGQRPAGPPLVAPAPHPLPLAAQAQAQAQAHPQPAVTLQAVTLLVALGVSGAERAGVLPAAFPGSARRGHQRDRQGSGLSRPGCLRGGVGFAPTQLPSASAEPGSACSSTGAQQAASPAPGPPRLHPCAPSWQALGSLDPPTPGEQPSDCPQVQSPPLAPGGRGLVPRGRTKPGSFAFCRKPSRGCAWGRGQLHDLPASQNGKSSSVCQLQSYLRGDGIQAPSRDKPSSSPPSPGPTPARL